MKNAIAIIIGAVIISATVSVVQGQGRWSGGSKCKDPVGLPLTSADSPLVTWTCDNKVFSLFTRRDGHMLHTWNIAEGTYSRREFIEID